MITRTSITATGQIADPLDTTTVVRGDPAYPMTVTDLLKVGYSPLRWVKTPPTTEPLKPSLLHLVRCMWLAPAMLSATYARRPDTYDALAPTCPSCKSVSPAKVCRACGLKRVNVASVKDWAGSSTYCANWTAQQTKTGRTIVAPSTWDAAVTMTKSLAADPCTHELWAQSHLLNLISGTWHDAATNLDIPVHCTLDFAPTTGSTLDMGIGTLATTSDADPATWTASAYVQGQHIVAALKHALFAAATGEPRSTHFWCICERYEPYLTARRRATPELMAKGSDTLAQLMAAYAQCLATQNWPAFDVSAPGSVNAWSEVFLEPWMTQGDGGATQYFALSAPTTH